MKQISVISMILLVVSAITVVAQTTTMTNDNVTGANSDTWNQAANWDNGVPSGTMDVVVASNVYGFAYDTNTPAYSGTLTIEEGATVRAKGNSTALFISTNVFRASSIIMKSGSFLVTSLSASPVSFPSIILNGDATVSQSDNWEDHRTRKFDGEVSGPGQLTINGRNNMTYELNTSNTFSGGLVATGNGNWRVEANATGALGTGDVTIGDTIGLRILAADAMADTATLYLNGGPDTKPNPDIKLVMGADDTIGGLVIDGASYPNGTYGRIGCPIAVSNELSLITGDGVLTVANATPDTNAPTITFSAVALSGSTNEAFATEPITYTITFDEPHTPALTANDLENTYGTEIEVLSFVPAIDGIENLTYEVVVKASSSGLLQLRIKSSVTINDLWGNALIHPAADNDTLAVNSLPLLGGELGVMAPFANGGINPATGTDWAKGDQYRLMFVTTSTTNATSTDIAFYNAFVQSIAASSTNYPLLGTVTWKVIGSTATVDARDNTGTNFTTNDTDVAIIGLDGATLIANDNTDYWDNSLQGAPRYDQDGIARDYGNVATGTTKYTTKGQAHPTQFLGASPNICYGRCTEVGWNWLEVYNGSASSLYPFYAISEPLSVISTAPKGSLLIVR